MPDADAAGSLAMPVTLKSRIETLASYSHVTKNPLLLMDTGLRNVSWHNNVRANVGPVNNEREKNSA